jgi:hypothetical protein
MSTVLEIESALQALPDEERWNLLSRFERDLWSEWDAEIAASIPPGNNSALWHSNPQHPSLQFKPSAS